MESTEARRRERLIKATFVDKSRGPGLMTSGCGGRSLGSPEPVSVLLLGIVGSGSNGVYRLVSS